MIAEEQILVHSPEELGVIIIGHLKQMPNADTDAFHLLQIMKDITGSNVGSMYPVDIGQDAEKAMFEAWNWLNVQGLLVMNDAHNGNAGYRVLSRRAMKLSAPEIKLYSLGLGLTQDQLHPSVAFKVWGHFTRSDYDAAVSHAGKAVEVKVREKSGLEGHGRSLIHKAFNPADGPLSDANSNFAENESRMFLFSGFLGTYKNPQSHRFIDLDDPLEAMQIVLFASRLLSILDDLPESRA